MTTTRTRRAPEPFPDASARALLELAVGAQQVYQEAEIHLTQVVKSAVEAGATWDHVAYWLETMTADEARERFENADTAVYLDDEAVIALSAVARRHGLKSLSEAATLALTEAVETLAQRTAKTTSDDGGDRAADGVDDEWTGDADDR